MSATLATKGAAITFAGGSVSALGQMAALTAEEWGILGLVVGLCLVSGNLAALGVVEYHNGHDLDRVKRERRLRVMIFLAQFVFGMAIGIQTGGSLWITMSACLAVGWTGTQFLDWLAKRSGFGGDK